MISRNEAWERMNKAAEEALQKEKELQITSHGTDVDAIFAGFAAMSTALQAMGRERAKIKKENRLERRRQKYALEKKLGILDRKKAARAKKKQDAIEEAKWQEMMANRPPESCTCWQGHAPCGWCTREIDDEEEE